MESDDDGEEDEEGPQAGQGEGQGAVNAVVGRAKDRVGAAGPGAVADLIRGGARKTAKATPPAKGKGAKPTTTTATPTKAATPARDRDPRLPRPGGVLTRTFQGKESKGEVLDAGFKYDGDTWRSLSAIARKVSGTSWNGYLFFNLLKRAAKPAATPTETK